jgi:O-antigen/teichoic acid export membrane protein
MCADVENDCGTTPATALKHSPLQQQLAIDLDVIGHIEPRMVQNVPGETNRIPASQDALYGAARQLLYRRSHRVSRINIRESEPLHKPKPRPGLAGEGSLLEVARPDRGILAGPMRHPLRFLRRALDSAFATTLWMTIAFSGVSGITGVIAARALGPYERGLLATAVIWSSVIGMVGAYGTPNAATYLVARDPGRPRRSAATVMAVGAAVGAAVSLIGVAVSLLIVPGAASSPLAIAFANVLPSTVLGAALGSILGLGQYRNWGKFRLVGPVLALIGVVVVTQLGWRNAIAVTVVTAIATILQLAALAFALRRRDLMHRPSRALVKPTVAYMWRNVVSGTGWLISNHLDLLILTLVVAPRLVGIYAVSVSFGALIQPIASSSGSVMLKRVAAGGEPAVRESLPRALATCVAIAVTAGTVVFIAAPFLVTHLFGAGFEDAVTPLRILLVGMVALSTSAVLADTLRGLGRPLAPARAELIGAIATLLLLPALLPPFGIVGAAIASTLSYSLVTVAMASNLRTAMRQARAVTTDP